MDTFLSAPETADDWMGTCRGELDHAQDGGLHPLARQSRGTSQNQKPCEQGMCELFDAMSG